MRKYTLYYNQKSMLIQAESFDMAYAGNKSWFTPGYVFFYWGHGNKRIKKIYCWISRWKPHFKRRNRYGKEK